jgi:hypothetical protein
VSSVEKALVNIAIGLVLYFLQRLFFDHLIQTLREYLLKIAFRIFSYVGFLACYFEGA